MSPRSTARWARVGIVANMVALVALLSSALAAVATWSPVRHTAADIPGGDLRLVFDDEFTSTSLSKTWATCWWYSPTPAGCSNGDHEGEWYTPGNVRVADGHLSLTACRQSVEGVLMSTGAPRRYAYTSGMVTTRGKFSFEYGYAEWRVELPSGQGIWPALWMLPADDKSPPELDALETVDSSDVGYFTYHPPTGPQQQATDSIPALYHGWHTFGVDWEPGSITWYVDGRKVGRSMTDVTNQPMYLIMDLAVGGTWPGYPDQSTPFPAALNVDYVRVWQHATGGARP